VVCLWHSSWRELASKASTSTCSSAQLKSVILKSGPRSDALCVASSYHSPLPASHAFSQTRTSQLNAKAIVTISALSTLLLAKSAISHAWALGMKQRQCLCARRGEARCGGCTRPTTQFVNLMSKMARVYSRSHGYYSYGCLATNISYNCNLYSVHSNALSCSLFGWHP